MKRKGLTIGLLLVVAAIWGAVLARIRRPEPRTFAEGGNAPAHVYPERMIADTLPPTEALGDHRDPIQAAAPARPSGAAPRRAGDGPPAPPKPVAVVPATVMWPRITYNGLLRNRSNSRAVALLNIDGRDVLCVQGVPDNSGLTVVEAGPDSVRIALRTELRSFRR